MTVQELIDNLNKIEDKSKEIKYSALYDINEDGSNYYCCHKVNEVSELPKEVWIKYTFK